MRLLSRLAIFLILAGLLLGWLARSAWGRPPRPWPWLLVFLPAAVHAGLVAYRAFSLEVTAGALLVYAGGSLLSLVAAVSLAAWAWRKRPWWLPTLPFVHALVHTVASSLLGEQLAAVAEAPPLVGPAMILGLAILSSSASLVLLLGRERPRPSDTLAP